METKDIEKKGKQPKRNKVEREKHDFHKRSDEDKQNSKGKRCLDKIARIRRQYKPLIPK